MKRFFGLFLVIAAIASCAEKTIEEPENLIPESKMVDILYDLAIINAAKQTNANVLVENNVRTMPYLFTKYKIDSVQFADSNTYYAADPIAYEGLYKEVQSKLDTIKKQVESKNLFKADSIAKSKEKKKPKTVPLKASQK